MSLYIKAFQMQFRAIYALLMREMLTRYGERKLGFLWVIIEALIHVAIFALIRYILGIAGVDGINFILFLITGIVPFFYFRNVANKVAGGIRANKGLLVLPGVSYMDSFYSRLILESATSIVTLFVAFVIAINVFDIEGFKVHDYLMVIKTFILIGMFGFGFGLIAAAISGITKTFMIATSIIIRLMYFTSGVMYSIRVVPERFHDILYWNPMVHCMERMREGFFSEYNPVEYLSDQSYVFYISLFMIFIGIILVNKMKIWMMR